MFNLDFYNVLDFLLLIELLLFISMYSMRTSLYNVQTK